MEMELYVVEKMFFLINMCLLLFFYFTFALAKIKK